MADNLNPVEASWRIELLGGVRAVGARGVVDRFRTQKTASLLALLAYPPGRARTRDELISLFWPEDDLSSARHKLSVALHALRQQLEPEGAAEGSVVRADRFNVSLAPEAVRTDVQEFRSALAEARRTSPPAERGDALLRALEIYGGEFVSGFYESWIFPEQASLTEEFVSALQELVRLREQEGDLAEALQAALRALAADPLREELHQEVMRIQLAGGRPAEALRQYALLETRLLEELDTLPSPRSQELRQQARSAGADPPAEPQRPSPLVPAEAPPSLEQPGGAVPLGSPFYIERATDAPFHQALERGDSIVLLKGPRQSGKTSLLARSLQAARERGDAVVYMDLQSLNADHLASADALLLAMAQGLCEQLDLEADPAESWAPRLGPSPSFRRYMRREVLRKIEGRLVWGLDQIDLLLQRPFATEVFGLFRSWHNERAFDPTGPWGGLTMAVAYATEAHLFITDLNQSLFNVGTRLYLPDFGPEHLADLNRRYGSPLRTEAELQRLFALTGGHPYLVRSAFHDLAGSPRSATLERLEGQSGHDEGVFDEPLRRILGLLRRDPELCEAVREILRDRGCPSLEAFYRLRSAGVVIGDAMEGARMRCGLYRDFLARHLL